MLEAAESRLAFYRRWHRQAAPYFRWQVQQFAPWVGKRVADVGCGPGNLAPVLLDRELYLGVDRDPALLGMLREEFGRHPGVATLVADVTADDFAASLRSQRVDTVLCLNLLEHIVDDAKALANLVAALPRGGILGLLVPALPWLFGTLDAADGHVRRYTRGTVRQLLAAQPLEVIDLRYFNMAGVLGWWWRGRVRRAERPSSVGYAGMNALIPIMRPIERLLPPPIGISVVAIARRQ